MITHILDSSAILAHYLEENGGEVVDEIITSGGELAISAVSMIELKTQFNLISSNPIEVARVFRLYTEEVATVLDLNREIANLAIELRENSISRLPTIDSIIAATAKSVDAILVHRDPHFAGIPKDELKQIRLPAK